jgi:hypothetical protein
MKEAELIAALCKNGWKQSEDGTYRKEIYNVPRLVKVEKGRFTCFSKYDKVWKFSIQLRLHRLELSETWGEPCISLSDSKTKTAWRL